MSAEPPVRIAFVDTGNTGRSITSEALALAHAAKTGATIAVISRAVDFNPFNIKPEQNFASLLLARGIDITAHRAQALTAQDAKFADLILTMTRVHKDCVIAEFPAAKDKVKTLADYVSGAHTDIADAFGKPMDFSVAILAQLDPLVVAAVEKATA